MPSPKPKHRVERGSCGTCNGKRWITRVKPGWPRAKQPAAPERATLTHETENVPCPDCT